MSGFPPSSTGMHPWTSYPPTGSSPRSQTTPSFTSRATGARSDALEPQMAPGYVDQSASMAHRTSPPSLPAYPLPAQFASGPPRNRYNRFPGQYVMPSHADPIQNQPPQPHVYHAYDPLESKPYPPTGLYPLPAHPPLPYFCIETHVQAGYPYYQQTQPSSLPMPQSATNVPTGSFGGQQQYLQPPYSSVGHFGLPQQYQCNAHQWHDGHPSSSANTLPMQAQQLHDPSVKYLHPKNHRLPKHSNVKSTDLERLSSPDPKSNSAIATPSRADLHKSVQDSPNIGAREPSNRSEASTSHTPHRPLVRRHYHPNPPSNPSEWVMWVGNVPSGAAHDELWRFLNYSGPVSSGSKDDGKVEDNGLVSIFLIPRSNCAFVNYRSEEQMNHAITKFNGSRLRPDDRRYPRLVCRARRKEHGLRAGVGAQRGTGLHTQHIKKLTQEDNELTGKRAPLSEGHRSRVLTSDPTPATPASRDEGISKSDAIGEVSPSIPTHSSSSYASTTSSFLLRHFPKRFFILKSLNQYDLELSAERGMWATQKHNETILDRAFRTSKEVILIFSVNKSGEFYGYARMASGILRSNHSVSWAPRAELSPHTSSTSSSLERRESPSTQHSLETNLILPEPRLTGVTPLPVEPSWAPRADPSSSTPGQGGSPLYHTSDKVTPIPGAPSTANTLQAESAQARRSAPPTFHRTSEDRLAPKPPLRSCFSCSNKGWPVTFQLSQGPGPGPSSALPELGKHFGVGPGARSKGGVDNVGGLGSYSHLKPVMEEVQGGNGAEEDIEPASMAVLSEAKSEVLRGEENWGETFKIEWLRTERIPFHQTRHLRNPWNRGREIKVARDGTEIEPTVGQQLIEEWPTLTGSTGKRGAKSVPATGFPRSRNVRK